MRAKKVTAQVLSSPIFRVTAGILIGSLALFLAVRDVSFPEVWYVINQVTLGTLVLALVSVCANILCKILRWRLLLEPGRQEIGLFKISASFMSAQILNALVPAKLGEFSRVLVIGKWGVGYSFVLGTIVVEKILDMIFYAFLLLILLLSVPLPTWMGNSGYAFAGVTVVISLIVLLVAFQRGRVIGVFNYVIERLPKKMQTSLSSQLIAGLSSLDVLKNRKVVIKLAFASALIWGTAVLTNHLVLLSLNIELPIKASILTLAALQAGISIPSLPVNIGVFEYVCVLTLGMFGVENSLALSYGILLHMIVYTPVVLFGSISLWLLGYSKKKITVTNAQEAAAENGEVL